MKTQSYDVIVIGAGLAGLMAALAAREQGAEVAVLAEGGGAFELSSGCIDLFGATESPWTAMTGLRKHPYTLLGAAAVREAVSAFVAASGRMGLPYSEPADGRNQVTVTAVGNLRTTYLPAPGAAVIRPDPAADPGRRPVAVIGLQGMKEFHPGVVAEGLKRALPGTPVTARWVPLPAGTPDDLQPVQLARLLEEPVFRAKLLQALPSVPAGTTVLMPAVLGLDGAEAVRADVSAALGAPVGEVPLLSPSLPGLRLATRLYRYVQRRGVELCMGVQAAGAAAEGGRITTVTGQTVGGPVTYRAGAVIVATGGLLGRGLEVRDRTLCETVFDLPVEQPGGPWADADLLSVRGHAFVRAGVRTDDWLRPEGRANLYICGKLLAGYDPYAEGCGGGVAIASGWRAGGLAGGAVR
ncbi:MAG TPA: anaerobic glycerol-3-phosphate dehydrogenase subunit GlpB [Symbiobacteriaceae bacterium]|nr:anaerobic glycerol-3-phosphate dehydrogenase subunit GlpB [Symbiobacteriaceae bacterium]